MRAWGSFNIYYSDACVIPGSISATVDSAGNIYVADCLNHRVQWWKPGATYGLPVLGANGEGGTSLAAPAVAPAYKWLVNDTAVGYGPRFVDRSPVGTVVTCAMVDEAVCAGRSGVWLGWQDEWGACACRHLCLYGFGADFRWTRADDAGDCGGYSMMPLGC